MRAWRLSRFAYVHREADTLIAASARSDARVPLTGPSSVAVVAALAQPVTVEDLARAVDARDVETITALVETLAAAGLIDGVDDGQLPEDRDPALRQWEFHDRLFRARDHLTRTSNPSNLEPSEPSPAVPLFAPDLEQLAATDPAFTTVLDSRRSIRRFGDPPISLKQLGEFLYRVSRGGTNGLTIYLSVDRCGGLEAGLFRYAAGAHALTRLSDRTAGMDELLENARRAGIVDRPQVLFTMTASRQDGASYGAYLIRAGALYQAMYLAATAMGLGPCAVGIGDAGLFARAAGVDPLAEPSVGEFAIGTIQAA